MKKFSLDGWLAGALFLFGAAVYFLGCVDFAFPGESAKLLALWNGFDAMTLDPYPLLSRFVGAVGPGNWIAPLAGAFALPLLFLVIRSFTVAMLEGGEGDEHRFALGRVAGFVAALVFALSPAVRSAATHLEPRLFDFTWLLLSFAAISLWAGMKYRKLDWAMPLLIGALMGLGGGDSPIFFVMLPISATALAAVAARRERGQIAAVAFELIGFFVAFTILLGSAKGDFSDSCSRLWTAFGNWFFDERNRFRFFSVFLFSTLPFLLTLATVRRLFANPNGFVQRLVALVLSACAMLAIATPRCTPAVVCQPWGILPVAATAFAAVVAGCMLAYWRLLIMSHQGSGKLLGGIAGGLLAFVVAFMTLFNFFTFDSSRGEFADRIAEKMIDELNGRHWLVSTGELDYHLKLVAARRGYPLEIISLQRDLDKDYLRHLAARVREQKLGGDQCEELAMSLDLGLLPFVQDWMKNDPKVGAELAVFGSPDLWYFGGHEPKSGFLLFGGDADADSPSALERWDGVKKMLEADEDNWGSYRLWKDSDPVNRMRLELRRHLGMVANVRAAALQDAGDDDGAYELYRLVYDEIDHDNVCVLFNLFEMAGKGLGKAKDRRFELERRIKSVTADPDRRYNLQPLANYYGYIRSPEIFVRSGFLWARSGRAGQAIRQIQRAIDLVPDTRRSSLMLALAELYRGTDEKEKAREIYEDTLSANADNYEALMGMMRIALAEGDEKAAMEYLERANAVAGDDPRAQSDKALLAMLKRDFAGAAAILRQIVDANNRDMHAWSMLASVLMQQLDGEADPAVRAALESELEKQVVPAMEKIATDPNDYNLQVVRAMLLLRKGDSHRREARDAFASAMNARAGSTVGADIVLGLDISLDDKENAEQHAKEVLARNRKAPLANYVMGSIAIGREDYAAAERYLKRATDIDKPVVLALVDLAEVYRRTERYDEAERYARLAIEKAPEMYVAYETVAAVILAKKGDLAEAHEFAEKAVELSRVKERVSDVRMFITLAKVQLAQGDAKLARATLRKVQSRIDELSDFERREYDALLENVR